MRARLASLAVVPLLALLASTSGAAPKPQVVDPKGDSAGGQASIDLVSVSYTTTGMGTGKRYIPKKLVVSLTLAAAPSKDPGVSYTVEADTDTCGVITARFAPGTPVAGLVGNTWATFGTCAESAYMSAKVKGNVVIWEFSLKAAGIDRDTEFFDFVASVNVTEPVGAFAGTDMAQQTDGVLDRATGAGPWRMQ